MHKRMNKCTLALSDTHVHSPPTFMKLCLRQIATNSQGTKLLPPLSSYNNKKTPLLGKKDHCPTWGKENENSPFHQVPLKDLEERTYGL